MSAVEPAQASAIEAGLSVLEAWNTDQGPWHRVQTRDVLWNLQRQNLIRYRATQLADVPVILATTSEEGERAGYSARSIWLALWGAIPKNREGEFIAAFQTAANESRRSRLVIGGDDFHWTCGIPFTPDGERLANAARTAGFATDEVVDYVGDLHSSAIQHAIAEAHAIAAREGFSFQIYETPAPGELEAIGKFLSAEFPGRWTREFEFWRDRQDTRCASWGLLREANGRVIGFARLAVRGENAPSAWWPGALRAPFEIADLGRVNDSCLGPIGIAASERGRGAGRALLGLVLATLQSRDAGRVCVDWTNAFKYYQPLHLKQARRYWAAFKSGI